MLQVRKDYYKMLSKILKVLLISSIYHAAFADDIQITGTIKVKPNFYNLHTNSLSRSTIKPQEIALLKLSLTNQAENSIKDRFIRVTTQQSILKNNMQKGLPEKVELGMNGIPTLNQGSHGSCVVFAVTAAVDAIIEKGDYVSQLCQLGLGRYLENNGYTVSGWDGAWSRTVLGQMDIFGIVSKDSQRTYGCAGLTEYPICGLDVIAEEPAPNFHKMSERLLDNKVAWSSIVDIYQVVSDNLNEEEILLAVKKSLLAGDRSVLGVLLLDFDKGVVGAQGTYKAKNDTWVITQDIINDIDDQTEFAGHALLITGYNDNAVATDAKGQTYKGLLTLRNSWGHNIGDKGDFYMSYDYFKALVLEVQRIRHL